MYLLGRSVIMMLFIHHKVPVEINNEKPQNKIFFPESFFIAGLFHVALQSEAVEKRGFDRVRDVFVAHQGIIRI